MSESNVTVKESAIQYGLVLGGILAISTVLMYALNQELFLSAWVGISTLIICVGAGIVSTGKAKDILGGIMTFKQAFTAYFITQAIGLLISTAIGILIFSIIDTELAAYLQEESIEMTRGFMERFDTPTEIIEETLSEMRQENNFSMVNQMKNYVGVLVVQAVIGLLIGLIFKKADPNAILKLEDINDTENNQIIGAKGKYGFDITNPIPTKSILHSYDWLKNLTTDNDVEVTYKRIYSSSSPNIKNSIDVYELFADEIKIATMYVSPYTNINSTKAPQGFKLSGRA